MNNKAKFCATIFCGYLIAYTQSVSAEELQVQRFVCHINEATLTGHSGAYKYNNYTVENFSGKCATDDEKTIATYFRCGKSYYLYDLKDLQKDDYSYKWQSTKAQQDGTVEQFGIVINRADGSFIMTYHYDWPIDAENHAIDNAKAYGTCELQTNVIKNKL